MKVWIALMDSGFEKGDDVETLRSCEGTTFFDKESADEWVSSEGDVLIEAELTSVKVMESQLKSVVAYTAVKPTTKKKGAK